MQIRSAWLGLLPIVGLLVAWELAARLALINPALLPPPSVVIPVLAQLLVSGDFLMPLAHTLSLMFVGYFIACVSGCALGLAMGSSKTLYDLLEPVTEIVRPIPKAALLPPLFLFLGMGLATKLTIVALAAFFPVLINTVQAVRGIDPIAVNTARTFGYSPLRTLFRVVLPASLPMIFSGMRISLGLALILVVLAEMLVDSNGIGYVILDMQRSFRVSEMYAWIVILAALGIALNLLFEALERRLLPWRSA